MAFDKNVPLAANQIAADLLAINLNWEILLLNSHVYAADAESIDTYVITLAPAIAAYTTGQVIHFYANTANTGACTLNVNGKGAKSIKKHHDQALSDGDIEATQIVTVVYDGTNFQMQSQSGNAPAKTGANTDITSLSGNITNATLPAFLAISAANQNDIAEGSAVTVVLGTEVFDQGGDFASNTFTAPVTGRYQLSALIYMNSVDSAAVYYTLIIVTSNRSYTFAFPSSMASADFDTFTLSGSILADMDANDTVTVAVYQEASGTVQTDLPSNACWFSGYLAC